MTKYTVEFGIIINESMYLDAQWEKDTKGSKPTKDSSDLSFIRSFKEILRSKYNVEVDEIYILMKKIATVESFYGLDFYWFASDTSGIFYLDVDSDKKEMKSEIKRLKWTKPLLLICSFQCLSNKNALLAFAENTRIYNTVFYVASQDIKDFVNPMTVRRIEVFPGIKQFSDSLSKAGIPTSYSHKILEYRIVRYYPEVQPISSVIDRGDLFYFYGPEFRNDNFLFRKRYTKPGTKAYDALKANIEYCEQQKGYSTLFLKVAATGLNR